MRGALLALLLMLAAPAAATQDVWPALYDVTGVAANDVLNVREAPDAGSPIIGALAPGATDVEVIRPNDRGTWALVNAGEGRGWVSLRFLARQPGQWMGAVPKSMHCSGTEPFWSLDLTSDARWSEMGGNPVTLQWVGRQASANRRDSYSYVASGAQQELAAVVRLAQCSNGMSDRAFGLQNDVLRMIGTQGPQHYSGCCSLAP